MGPILFTSVWLTGPLWHPAYNAVTDSVSQLAVGHGGWVQTANFIVLAVLSLCLAATLAPTLPPDRLSQVAVILLIVFSAGIFGAGVFNVGDASSLHQVCSAIAFVSIIADALVFAAIYRSRKTVLFASFSVAVGIAAAGLLLVVLFGVPSNLGGVRAFSGLVQRFFILTWSVWLEVLALRVISSSARPRPAAERTGSVG
jgi:hypothetical protein